MSASLFAPAGALARAIARAAGLALLAALLGACSSSKQPAGPKVFAWLSPEPPPVAVVQAEAELEDDGLPSQAPPLAARSQDPDDPAAPWSRNYGRAMPASGEGTAEPAVVDDEILRGDDSAADGLPVPMSPEEAGIRFEPTVRPKVRPVMARSMGMCDMGRPWTCPR